MIYSYIIYIESSPCANDDHLGQLSLHKMGKTYL